MNKWLSNLWNDERPIAPSRAVMHPAWILAVFILIVNDHVLKPAAFAEPLAGKVSDLAGLFLFPVLLATLLHVRTRRGLWLTGAATAVVFAAINTSSALAATFDGLVSVVVPFATTVDPTDLVALPAIGLGLLFFEPLMLTTSVNRTRRALEAAAVTLGGLASMATSGPVCEDCIETNQSGQVSILNKTNELHVLRIRTLRGGVQLDCETVMADPARYLVDGAFDAPLSWFLQSGQEIPVRRDFGATSPGDCQVALIESDTAPDIFVAWPSGLETKWFAFDADVPREIPADDQTIVLDADYSRSPASEMHSWRERTDCGERADLCGDQTLAPLATIPTGARYFWRTQYSEPLHFTRPNVVEGTVPQQQCDAPTAADGLVWEDPPRGELYVLDVVEGRDGCHELILTNDLENTDNPLSWWICAPIESLAEVIPTADAQKRIVIAVQNQDTVGSTRGYRGLEISVVTLGDDLTGQQIHTIFLVRGYGLPPEFNFGPEPLALDGCGPTEIECGQIAEPVRIRFAQYGEIVVPGESMRVGEVQPVEIHLVRAETRPVHDTTCAAGDSLELPPPSSATSLRYMETVFVRQDGGR